MNIEGLIKPVARLRPVWKPVLALCFLPIPCAPACSRWLRASRYRVKPWRISVITVWIFPIVRRQSNVAGGASLRGLRDRQSGVVASLVTRGDLVCDSRVLRSYGALPACDRMGLDYGFVVIHYC